MGLIDKNAHFALGDIRQFNELKGSAVTVLHADDVGFLGYLLECADWNCDAVVRGIVVDHDAQLRKSVGNVVIELNSVIDCRLVVEGDTEQ